MHVLMPQACQNVTCDISDVCAHVCAATKLPAESSGVLAASHPQAHRQSPATGAPDASLLVDGQCLAQVIAKVCQG